MSEALTPPQHGGDLNRFNWPVGAPRPLLNLATGVNPWPWPVPTLPADCFTDLPYDDPALLSAAARYYQVNPQQLLMTAGSQPVIQLMPRLYAPGRVLLPRVAYEEHAYRWQRAGHECHYFADYHAEAIAEMIAEAKIQYLVLVSPNNPDGREISQDDLSRWLAALPEQGCLLVDQAYVDCQPALQANALVGDKRVVLLRSVGKFFGLPGLRLGAVLAHPETLVGIGRELGPWSVNQAAQWLGRQLFADRTWQDQMRAQLTRAAARQRDLLAACFGPDIVEQYSSPLFTTLRLPLGRADELARQALAQGLLCRIYRCGDEGYMRWGLCGDEGLLAERLEHLRGLLYG